jgi:folate-binding protein YgfZ
MRRILEIGGEDRVSFLQGLVTNDIDRRGLTYTALLTPQGKFIVDFFALNLGDVIWLDVAADYSDMLAQRLTMYRLRAKVTIAFADATVTRGLGGVPIGAYADPRHADMGWRGYSGAPEDNTDWVTLGIQLLVPETGIELTPDTYILEAGFERLNGVDFRKGCYVGQEITARMKHKTELRKGLAQVQVSAPVPVGTEITVDGKPAGTLFRQSDGFGLAHLRYDRATGDMQAGAATVTLVKKAV